MALGADGSPPTRAPRRGSSGAELAAMGVNQNYSPVADVNVNPANPVIGVRSFGADPAAVAALVGRAGEGLPGRRDRRHRQALPRPRRHRHRQPPGLPVITPHAASSGETLDAAALPRRDRGRHRLDHDRAHPGPGPRPLRRPGHAVPAHPHRRAARGARLRRRGGHRRPRHGRACGTKYGDDRVPVLALKAGADQLLNPPPLDVAYRASMDAVARRADRGAPGGIVAAHPAR